MAISKRSKTISGNVSKSSFRKSTELLLENAYKIFSILDPLNNDIMKNKSQVLLIIGIIALVIGSYLYFQVDTDAVNQKNIEIATTATSAEEAAKQISANNKSEVGDNSIALFLLGLGGVLTLVSIINMVKKKPI
ncbi:hypothetical protein [Chryseobacterium sp. 3008163]|uniref:hypothetical protein n=1 Tax=Chryseobacterium sp. 3008163 TaxID=2478663 RepID=UPI001013CF70|nr:hypothetical protein [Chryseobacterium sp. 3008163]